MLLVSLFLVTGCATDATAPTATPIVVPDALDDEATLVSTEEGPPASWLSEVSARVQAASYGFGADGAAWQAGNPAHGLSARMDAGAMRVTRGDASVTLALAAWGTDGVSVDVDAGAWSPGACVASGAVDPAGACVRRLEGSRAGLREWWENGPFGIEQGFVVDAPVGDGDLVLDLAVTGAEVEMGAGGARLLLEDGGALRYDGLWAADADGVELPARMESGPFGIRLRVDVSGAAWPVEIDPVLASYWLDVGPSTSAYFGQSVDGAGDVNGDGYADVVIGAYGAGTSGTVYVYHGSSAGLGTEPDWSETHRTAGVRFGYSVAGAGDVNGDGYDDVIIGAPYLTNPTNNEGGAYVYLGSLSGLASSAVWSTESSQASAQLGHVVASAGDVNGDGYDDVLVGAPYYDNGSTDEGQALLFFGSASGPSVTADWTAEPNQASASFGITIGGAGDVNGDGYADVAVGATRFDNGHTDEGRVSVYLGSSSGPSTAADWTFEANQASAYCGTSLVGPGDVNGDGYDDFVLGASYYDNGSTNEGYIWGFHGSAGGLAATASWYMEGSATSVYLGTALGAAGDVNADGYPDLVVGKSTWNSGAGEFHLFTGSSAGLSELSVYAFQSGHVAGVGGSVAGAGDIDGDGYGDVIVGGSTWSTNTGLAIVQYGEADGLTASNPWTWGLTSTADLGTEVADAGDVNGDGYGDVAVYADTTGTSDYVYVYEGTASGLPATANVTLSGSGAWLYGADISGAGDVDGDGYDDIVVSAAATEVTYTNEGSVWVYYGSGSGVTSASYSRIDGGQANAYFGSAVAGAGDTNGDGYDDLVVGAYAYDDGHTNEGKFFVYEGSSAGIETTAAWSLGADQASANLGYHVGGAGDVNGDGYDDVLGGAIYYDDGQTNEGLVFLALGSATGLTASTWTAGGNQNDAQCSHAVGVGDLDGDGYDDIARGCRGYDGAGTSSGRVDVWLGGAAGPATTPDWSYLGAAAGDYVGRSVAGAGDLNSDGYADLVVGADGAELALTDQGIVYVFYGSATGLDDEPNVSVVEQEASAGLGYVVSGTSDVNGDGSPEVMAGASGLGHVYLYEFPDADGDGSMSWEDCDEADDTIYPGAAELCDGLDNDCDGFADEEVATWYDDDDGDGYGDAGSGTVACAAPAGSVSNDDDCDDTDELTSPDAVEACDGDDNDCDGLVDESGATGATTLYADEDNDGYGDPGNSSYECLGTAGYVTDGTDCDDAHVAVRPGAVEACNGIDDDCDSATDEAGATGETTWYADVDNDGYGVAGSGVVACDAPSGYIGNATDCDDGDVTVSPDGTETCDGVDDDCDGVVDDGVLSTFYADVDGDGYGTAGGSIEACAESPGYVANTIDCDDGDATIAPFAAETCNGVDDDCDGAADEGLSSDWYPDADGDGYGTRAGFLTTCAPPAGYVATADDCNDTTASVNPGAAETCDGIDEDCDGTLDDGFALTTWYADQDGDGLGTPSVTESACAAPPWYVGNAADCDDTDAAVGEAASWYADADEDGYGDATTETGLTCNPPEGYVLDGTDCDDTEAAAYPGADEVWYDGIDEACDGGDDYDADGDGQASATYDGEDCDDADATVYTGAPDDPYDGIISDCVEAGEYDGDADGYTAEDFGGDDCDDARSDVNPGADEVWYDGIDQDCDGTDDDQDADGLPAGEDCDDEDPDVGLCVEDSGDPIGGDDTGITVKDGGGDCGCNGGGAGPVGALVLVLAALGARRRPNP